MKNGVSKLMRVTKRKGQAVVEYALILALVSTVCFFALRDLGQQLAVTFNRVTMSLSQVAQQQQEANPITPVVPPTPCNNGNGHGHGYGRCK